MIKIEDFFPIYPTIDNEHFYQDIYNKKEFNDQKLEKYEPKPKYKGDLLKHQKFVSRFLSSHTPYNGLLLYHEMGSGKTCSAVATAELIHNQDKKFNKAIYIARGETLINKFIKEVACICTNGKYIPEGEDCKDAKFGAKRDKISKKVREFYTFYTYDELRKSLKKANNLAETFSNSIIIVDEVQNIRQKNIQEEGEEKEYKDFYRNLHQLFHSASNRKILLLSGTPMRDLPKEIVDILNLILPLDKQIEIIKNFEQDYFNEEETIELKKTKTFLTKYKFKPEKIPEFKQKIKGHVSFLKKITNPNINIIYEGEHVHNIKNLFVTPLYLKIKDKPTYQNVGYVQSVKKDLESNSLSSNQMQASLFVWRDDNKEYKWGKDLTDIMDFKQTFSKSKLLLSFRKKFAKLSKKKKLKRLEQYSLVYATIIRNILKNKGLHYVFFNLVAGSGAILFSKILSMFEITNVPLVDSAAIDKFNDRHFQLENNPVAIGIPRVTEGINLENVEYIHITTPSRHFNNSETSQAIARAIRLGSHDKLLEDRKTAIPVRIYKYVSIPVNMSNLEPVYDLSINYDQYLRAEIKDYNIKQIDRILMENSVDCQLNCKRNIKSDKDFSRDCEYNKCKYKCDGITELNPVLDYSTYNLYYADISKILQKISEIFRTNFIQTFSQLLEKLKEYTNFNILAALQNMISTNHIIYNKWGLKSYLREKNDLYFLIYDFNIHNDNLIEYYCKYVSNKDVMTSEDIIEIIINNQIKFILKILEQNIPKYNKINGQIFDSLPLNMKQIILENAIISVHLEPNKKLKEWLISYNKNYIIESGEVLYLTLDIDNIKKLQDNEWVSTKEVVYPLEEIYNKFIKDNKIKFYGILARKGGSELFKIRDITKPEYYIYMPDKGNLIRAGKKCESYDQKTLKKIKKILTLDSDSTCDDIKNEFIKLKLMMTEQENKALLKYMKTSKKRKREDGKNEKNILIELLDVRKKYMKDDVISAAKLRKMLQKPLMKGHQDTHEYCLDLLLDSIKKLIIKLSKTKRNAYKKILGIDTKSTIKWGINDEKSHTITSTSLALPIVKTENSTLQELFAKYEKPEDLKGDNQYETDEGQKVDATKQLKITHWPNFLIVSLRRFKYDYELKESVKIEDKVLSVNDELKFTYDNQNYELLSMNVHSGTVAGGHYIAYSKINGIWYEENDSEVNPIDKNTVKQLSEQAYILIFKKSRAKNPSKKSFKPAGIRNDGSTCYFNSCLQTILAINPLWKFLNSLKV